jgi:membrane protease YdiL (CAAX protease family)
VVTTVLFVMVHLPYAARYWPAAAGITLLAVFLVAIRLQTGSLVPSIAAHFAYNSIIVVAAYTARATV